MMPFDTYGLGTYLNNSLQQGLGQMYGMQRNNAQAMNAMNRGGGSQGGGGSSSGGYSGGSPMYNYDPTAIAQYGAQANILGSYYPAQASMYNTLNNSVYGMMGPVYQASINQGGMTDRARIMAALFGNMFGGGGMGSQQPAGYRTNYGAGVSPGQSQGRGQGGGGMAGQMGGPDGQAAQAGAGMGAGMPQIGMPALPQLSMIGGGMGGSPYRGFLHNPQGAAAQFWNNQQLMRQQRQFGKPPGIMVPPLAPVGGMGGV